MDESYSLKQRLILLLGAPLIAWTLRVMAASWRSRLVAHPGTLPREAEGPLIYVFWHESVVTITGHWRGENIQGLASRSFDGALISRVMRYLGFPPLSRGSSSRGGERALRQHLEALAAGRHVVVTLDGPRGPRYQAKAGALLMAQRSGRPVVPVACATWPDWRLKSWDRTQLPPPFARVAFVLGEPFCVPPGDVEALLQQLQTRMQAASQRAQNEIKSEVSSLFRFGGK